ncbi:CPBP family intramembrane glutamic endopeptidase [Brachybacterium phenoliresistens]|uniref:CPBP family intramembrane glutamic endopeptidase n=1 Tax=Brachybacterium phenoliresistens TaxID=396014 RepID=UPI0004AE87F5|nr:CPBP family intramembrane glutamic endopeptidase [Brachybacterium phenoliresistens]
MSEHPVPLPAAGPVAEPVAHRVAGPAPGPAARPEPVDPSRPFGAHLRMRWWRPLVILPILAVAMFGLQIALTIVVVVFETVAFGRDPSDMSLSPLLLLSTNISLAVLAPLALLLAVRIGGVPWRAVLRVGRSFRWGRMAGYFGLFALLIGAVYGISAIWVPMGEHAPMITATTLGLIAVALLTTPLQAAAEEVVFRGVTTAAVASWIRPAAVALPVGIAASSVLFGLAHGAGDPWLIAYYIAFGLSMALMALISRGLEAPIAFHVTNNLISMVLAALLSGGGGLVIDRSAGAGGPFMLVFIGMDLAAVGIVWLLERRRRAADPARTWSSSPERSDLSPSQTP